MDQPSNHFFCDVRLYALEVPTMSEMRLGSLLLLVASVGCVGTVGDAQKSGEPGSSSSPGDPSTGGGSPSTGGGTMTGGSAAIPGTNNAGGCQEMAPLVTAARRLTRDQYVNTVRDLIGDAAAAAGSQLPQDDLGDAVFADPRTLIVSPDWATSAMNAAEAAAKVAVTNLQTLMPCDPSTGEQACVDKFINGFGKRAFRRPVEPTELAGLEKVYAAGAKNGGYAHGIEVVVRAMLQAPSFLYRLELGQKDGSAGSSVHLAQYEIASRLSYLMWNSMPDQTLMQAADDNQLNTGDQLVAQARRMLADPRAHQTLGTFHGKWLGIDGLMDVPKDPAVYPMWNDQMIDSMRTELQMYVEDVLFKGDGRMESLFTSSFTYVDASLAPLYGVTPPSGTGFQRVDLNSAQRAGILTNVGVITSHTYADESEAIHRGKFVRENLLCTIPPDPPADLMVMPPTPKAGVSIRERLNEHSAMPACKVCHQMMDPIGFGFEAYDGLGRYRTMDPSGKPVDDTGTLDMVKGQTGPVAFKGALELGQKLSGSQAVRDCLVSNVVTYSQGPDAAGDACVQQKMSSAFEAAKHDIRELFIAVTTTDGFRFRRAIQGEVLP